MEQHRHPVCTWTVWETLKDFHQTWHPCAFYTQQHSDKKPSGGGIYTVQSSRVRSVQTYTRGRLNNCFTRTWCNKEPGQDSAVHLHHKENGCFPKTAMSTFLKDRIDSRGVKESIYVKLEEPPLPSPPSFTTIYTSIRESWAVNEPCVLWAGGENKYQGLHRKSLGWEVLQERKRESSCLLLKHFTMITVTWVTQNLHSQLKSVVKVNCEQIWETGNTFR